MPITILFALMALVLIAVAVLVYGVSRHLLHEYNRPMGIYAPFGDQLRP